MLTLTDASEQEADIKRLRTDDLDSFTAEFVLPSVCLNDILSLNTQNGFRTTRVGDYKRPTLDIAFGPVTENYRLGDCVELKGNVKTFSDTSL